MGLMSNPCTKTIGTLYSIAANLNHKNPLQEPLPPQCCCMAQSPWLTPCPAPLAALEWTAWQGTSVTHLAFTQQQWTAACMPAPTWGRQRLALLGYRPASGPSLHSRSMATSQGTSQDPKLEYLLLVSCVKTPQLAKQDQLQACKAL